MPPQHANANQFEILSELESHNAFFDSIVNMIPAKLYVAGHSDQDTYHSKYLKGQNKESKEAKRARSKIAKREKFDPEKAETTLQTKMRIQREREEAEDSSDDGGDHVLMEDGDDTDEMHYNDQKMSRSSKEKSSSDDSKSNASRIEQLRAKLHAKIAQKRSASGISEDGVTATNTTSPALVSKRAARRAEKRKRQEAAKQRKKSAPSSVQDRSEPHRVVNLGGSKLNEPTSKKLASAADDLATIDYQSIAGLKKLDPKFDDKSLNPKVKKKSLEKLLADAERKQQRLKELKESSAEEDKEKAKNIEWGEALKVAE